MQKTTNFQLNQWEKTDRIMMEDFNSDNEKLEAALNAIWDTFPLVKLADYTLASETTHTDLDLSGVDLTNYRTLQLYIRFPLSSAPPYQLSLRVNHLANGYYGSDGENDEAVMNYISVNQTMSTAGTDISVGRYLLSGNRTPVTADKVTSLNLMGVNNTYDLSNPTPIPAGTKIILCGMKI